MSQAVLDHTEISANMPPVSPEGILLTALLLVLDERDARKSKSGRTVDLLAAQLRRNAPPKLTRETAPISRAISGALAIVQGVQRVGGR